MTVPDRSLRQRMDALAKGNDVRTRRAQLKRDLKAGRASAATVLIDPPRFVESMKVDTLLRATPKVGPVKARKLLESARVSPSKTLGGLNARQRGELAQRLPAARRRAAA